MTSKSSNKKYSLSAFFPLYNEEQNIRSATEMADSVLRNMSQISEYEIILVDDGSKDKTREIGELLEKENSNVRLISHPTNMGYGSALMTGIHAARFDYVFFTDGDLQFDMRSFPALTAYIPEYDVAIGYRSPRKDPFLRLVNAWGWNLLNRMLFDLRVRDIDCAFKLFRRDTIANLPIRSKGAMVSAELLIRLKQNRVQFKEVPVEHLPRKAGSPTGAKPSVIFRAFKEMFSSYRNGLGDARREINWH